MRVTGIHHVSILVADMEAAVAWYRDVLGLAEVPRPPGVTTPVRWFALGEQQIHLIPAERPDPVSPRHFALHVEDARAARAAFAARGIPIQETTPIPGADRFFVADPSGNHLELIQWLADPAEAPDAPLPAGTAGPRAELPELGRR